MTKIGRIFTDWLMHASDSEFELYRIANRQLRSLRSPRLYIDIGAHPSESVSSVFPNPHENVFAFTGFGGGGGGGGVGNSPYVSFSFFTSAGFFISYSSSFPDFKRMRTVSFDQTIPFTSGCVLRNTSYSLFGFSGAGGGGGGCIWVALTTGGRGAGGGACFSFFCCAKAIDVASRATAANVVFFMIGFCLRRSHGRIP
jgi:hypothetical protein